jgi:hypothetical protein
MANKEKRDLSVCKIIDLREVRRKNVIKTYKTHTLLCARIFPKNEKAKL